MGIMGTMYPLDPRAYSYPSTSIRCPLVDPIYPATRGNSSNLTAFITCHMKLDPILHGVIQIGVKIFLKNIPLQWKTLQQLCLLKLACNPLLGSSNECFLP